MDVEWGNRVLWHVKKINESTNGSFEIENIVPRWCGRKKVGGREKLSFALKW